MNWLLRFTGGFCAFAFVAFTASADTSWISGAGGLWSDPLNWSTGLPHSMQGITTINNSGTKTITLDGSADTTNRVIQRMSLSAGSGGTTNTLLIDGVTLEMRNTLTVDTGGEIIITNNGGLRMAGSGSTSLNINAGLVDLLSGSVSSLMSTTRVGRVKEGFMTLRSGSTANLSDVLVGDFSGSSGVLVVDGGILNVSSNLVVADDIGSTGAVVIVSGELNMSNSNAVLRVGDENVGQMQVLGGTVRLDVDDLAVARRTNSVGFLGLSGGQMIITDLSIGRFAGATGIVAVTGGELLATNDSIRIGRDGFGRMYISNGVVRANDAVISMNASGAGFLHMEAGEFHVTSNLVVNGLCALTGGTLSAGHLYATNVNSLMQFTGGTIRSGSASVSNGSAFVVGDGIRPATYHMNGGVHEFVDGLILSANATLSGCGTIIGNVINNGGTISTNCPVLAPRITSTQHAAGVTSFSFESQSGVSYLIQYKNALTDPDWTTLETIPGTGGVVTVTDPSSAVFSRFYRIQIP